MKGRLAMYKSFQVYFVLFLLVVILKYFLNIIYLIIYDIKFIFLQLCAVEFQTYLVVTEGIQFVVNMKERSCSCAVWN